MNTFFQICIGASGLLVILLTLLFIIIGREARAEYAADPYPMGRSAVRWIWAVIIGVVAAGVVAMCAFGLAVLA